MSKPCLFTLRIDVGKADDTPAVELFLAPETLFRAAGVLALHADANQDASLSWLSHSIIDALEMHRPEVIPDTSGVILQPTTVILCDGGE